MAGSPQHATLVADTVTTLTFDEDFPQVEVLSVDGADRVFFTVNGVDPEVDGTGSHVLPAAISYMTLTVPTTGPTVVKLLSESAVRVSARGLRS